MAQVLIRRLLRRYNLCPQGGKHLTCKQTAVLQAARSAKHIQTCSDCLLQLYMCSLYAYFLVHRILRPRPRCYFSLSFLPKSSLFSTYTEPRGSHFRITHRACHRYCVQRLLQTLKSPSRGAMKCTQAVTSTVSTPSENANMKVCT